MKPSLQKIIWSDYLTLVSVLFPIILWLIYLDSITTQFSHMLSSKTDEPIDPAIFIWIAVGGSATFIPILLYRVSAIYKHFTDSEIVEGTITMIRIIKDRGRVEYSYHYSGQTYHTGNAIHKNKFTKSLREGDHVDLAVSRSNPSKALIKEMYVS